MGLRRETVLNQYQLRLPMVDVVSIGAGGGSIAWVDGGRLRIGPKSASANPGPACYGQGGEEPTVTDADVVLGYMSPDRFLGGRMALDPDLAAAAIEKRIAGPLFGGDVIAAAAGIRRVVDSQMADLIRKTTLQRGYDPRALRHDGLWRVRTRPRRVLRRRPRGQDNHRPVPRLGAFGLRRRRSRTCASASLFATR